MKLIRITTVPISLKLLITGQMGFMRSQGMEVIAVSATGPEIPEIIEKEGVTHFSVPFTRKISPIQDLYCLVVLVFFLLKERPSVVHTHTPKAGLLGMLAAYVCRVPGRIHTVAGMPLMEYTGFTKKLLIWMERLTYACATTVLPNSKKMKSYIVENIQRDETKIQVIGNGSSNGIDLAHFKRSEALQVAADNIKADLGLPSDSFIWLFIGRLVGDKGIHELIEAFEIHQKDFQNHHLIVVGPFEDEKDGIKPNVRHSMAINPAIHLVGYQQDVRPWLQLADVFVFPSYREGFPNVLLQALAMGLPCIASDIIGCNEIIEHGKNGYLVPPKDAKTLVHAMQLFSTDTMRIEKEGENIYRQSVSKLFDRQMIWQQLHNLYSQYAH